MTSKRIVLFSQPGCRPCHALHAYLTGKGVAFENRDVSSDAHAVSELVYKYGSRITPTLVIDDEVVIGFDQARIDLLLSS
jgi:glutaredoxin-like YruB-family protein